MKTKQIINEWKSFLLSEHRIISLDELTGVLQRNKRSEQEINILKKFWNRNKFITKYTQVILNELNNTQESIREILNVCKLHYLKIYQSSGPKLKNQIGGGNISIDELRKQIDSKTSFNKNEIRSQCGYQSGRPVVGSYQDFDVVYSEADYIVIEPKTIQGSIAWAHGKPDGSEELDQNRRVGWCTGVSSGNNMFPNYAGNLHMFYIINANYENDNSVNRKLCLSFKIENGEGKLELAGSSTVNALNKNIEEEFIAEIQKQKYFQDILQRLKGRKNTSFEEIYKKATLPQIKRIINQMKRQKISEDLIEKELYFYLKYTNDEYVSKYLYQEENHGYEIVKYILLSRETMNLPFKEYSELFQKANFDSFVKEYYSKEFDLDEFWEKYSDLLDYFDESNIFKENPAGVYNLFKSIGIDLSDNHSVFNVFFEDIMACGYVTYEEMFDDKPYLKPVFGRNIGLNESILKKYISLIVS